MSLHLRASTWTFSSSSWNLIGTTSVPCQKKLVNCIVGSFFSLLKLLIKTLFCNSLFGPWGNHVLKYLLKSVNDELRSYLTIQRVWIPVPGSSWGFQRKCWVFSVNLHNTICILKSDVSLYERKGRERNESFNSENPSVGAQVPFSYADSSFSLHWNRTKEVDVCCEFGPNKIQLELTWMLFWCKIQSFCKFILSSILADLQLVNPVEGE